MDPYEVLEVRVDADAAAIRRSYLSLARRYHPDGHGSEGPDAISRAERRMQEVNAAWEVLGDPARRREYDAWRAQGNPAGDQPTTGPTRPSPTRPASGGGWHPRADDTGWLGDFEEWRNETDDLLAPERPRTEAQKAFTVLPVATFVGAVIAAAVGTAVGSRGLIAVAIGGVMVSAFLFLLLTLLELRGRDEN